MRPNLDLSSLPVGVLVILAVLVLAEVALDVIALVSLARRDRSMVALGNRWVWLAIIVLVNPIGAILYLAVGRRPVLLAEEAVPAANEGTSRTSVADALYGERDDQDGR